MTEQEINDRNIKMLTSKIHLQNHKYRGVQDRKTIEDRIKKAEEKRDNATKNADWFTWTGSINALKWVLNAEVEEDITLQRESSYTRENRIK